MPAVRLSTFLHDAYRAAPRRPHSTPQVVSALWAKNRRLRIDAAFQRESLDVAILLKSCAVGVRALSIRHRNPGTAGVWRTGLAFAGWPLEQRPTSDF